VCLLLGLGGCLGSGFLLVGVGLLFVIGVGLLFGFIPGSGFLLGLDLGNIRIINTSIFELLQ
jgi:hypothetical protein